MGLPKTARLRTQRDYDRVHGAGLRFHGRYLAARVELPGIGAEASNRTSQLGLRVAKRHGNAVLRNRIKRLLREGFRRSWPEWPVAAAVVLVPKTNAWPELKLRDLQDDFERLGRQIARWAAGTNQGAAPAAGPDTTGDGEPNRDR